MIGSALSVNQTDRLHLLTRLVTQSGPLISELWRNKNHASGKQ